MVHYPVCVSGATKERINPLGLGLDMFLVQCQLMEVDADTGDKGVILMQVTGFFFFIMINFMVNTPAAAEFIGLFFFFPGCKAS